MLQSDLSIKKVLDSIIPISRFNRGEANKIFDEVTETGVKVVLKNNIPIGVLVDPQQYEDMVETLEEYALFFEAEQRMRNVEKGGFLSEKQVMEDLDITESDLDKYDVEIE
jgi:PHD/YefM family antitoxin component YafN of YafNO toxin-antitoxin module